MSCINYILNCGLQKNNIPYYNDLANTKFHGAEIFLKKFSVYKHKVRLDTHVFKWILNLENSSAKILKDFLDS